MIGPTTEESDCKGEVRWFPRKNARIDAEVFFQGHHRRGVVTRKTNFRLSRKVPKVPKTPV